MKKIKLTQGKFATVDDKDYKNLIIYKWQALHNKKINSFVAGTTINRKTILMHRLVVSAPKGKEVDHKNHDTLDNRRKNLRICTKSENQSNRKPNRTKNVKSKGVSWHKASKKFIAEITVKSKRIYLGLFPTESKAAKAYNEAARKLQGKFAYSNVEK